MKRIVAALTLMGFMLGSTPSLRADGWSYGTHPYPQPVQQQGNPVLKKVLIGAGLIGAGYLLGRLTAPKPGPVYGQPPVQVGPRPWPQGGSHHHGHGHMPTQGYRF